MGYYYESECNGCAECIGCGRRHRKYKVLVCDKCKEDSEKLFYYDGRELCWDCYKAKFISKICDDMDETACEECGYEADEMFQVDGSWVCESCLEELAEEVE